MQKYILTVTLNPAIDKIFLYSKKDDYLKERPLKKVEFAGGKGINVARTLNQLNAKTLATGIIGHINSKTFTQLLKEEGVRFKFSETEGSTRVNETIVTKKGELIARFVKKGPQISEIDGKRFLRLYSSLVKNASLVVLSGRKANGVENNVYHDLIGVAHKFNKQVFLDSSGQAMKKAIKARPDFIKPNVDEFAKLFNKKVDTLKKISEAIQCLHKKGVRTALVSLGENGCIGSNGDEMWHVKPLRISVKNEVGCGDAFSAGFIKAFLEGMSFLDSLSLATAIGTASTQSLTPGLTSEKKALELRKTLKVRKLI